MGYYYVLKINEKKYGLDRHGQFLNIDCKNNQNIYFEWVEISKIDNYKIVPNIIVQKIKETYNIDNNYIEHLIYKEF